MNNDACDGCQELGCGKCVFGGNGEEIALKLMRSKKRGSGSVEILGYSMDSW